MRAGQADEVYVNLRALILQVVRLIEQISKDMCSYWYYGVRHEELLTMLIQ